jgi:porphobilinogen synthase
MPRDSITTPGRLRPRRLRRTAALRDLVGETEVAARQLIMPHFVMPADTGEIAIPSMPGIAQMGVENLLAQVESDLELGIRSVLLFGHPETGAKTPTGAAAAAANGAVQRAVARLKQAFGAAALSPARAGADVVAPSDMMDGRVAAIRDALDAQGFDNVIVLSYAVKYASAYYGPFRDAADSTPTSGDRKSYQMDCRNVREALREAELDTAEGADMLMVKPALPYLDVIRAVREVSELPLAAYNVSGEYSAVKAAAANGWLDEAAVVRENLLAIRRAGADQIITYHARDALGGGWL